MNQKSKIEKKWIQENFADLQLPCSVEIVLDFVGTKKNAAEKAGWKDIKVDCDGECSLLYVIGERLEKEGEYRYRVGRLNSERKEKRLRVAAAKMGEEWNLQKRRYLMGIGPPPDPIDPILEGEEDDV